MRQWRWAPVGFIYLALLGGGFAAGHWLAEIVSIDVRPSNEPQVHLMVMAAAGVYLIASAIPFVPGAEIGFALLLTLGTPIVLLVYAAMVAALLLSFLVGRFVPPRVSAAAFGFLGLHKARDLVLDLARLDSRGRLELLSARAPHRVIPFLLRHRYIALAAALNLPGNTVFGGGGGIALAAGMSGLFHTLPYAITIALAVAPLPALILMSGYRPGG